MKRLILLAALISAGAHTMAAETAPFQFLVPGSDEYNFGVRCTDNGQVTYSINEDKNNDYRLARNIIFTNMGQGRVAISLLHGFTSADKPSTYLTSPSERCETFKQ